MRKKEEIVLQIVRAVNSFLNKADFQTLYSYTVQIGMKIKAKTRTWKFYRLEFIYVTL